MKNLPIFVLLFLLPVKALAEDRLLNPAEIKTLLAGNTAIGYWGPDHYRQFFYADGVTIYAPKGQRSARGKWRVTMLGHAYQSWWGGDPNHWDGFDVVENANRLFWVDPQGQKFSFDILEGQNLVWE